MYNFLLRKIGRVPAACYRESTKCNYSYGNSNIISTNYVLQIYLKLLQYLHAEPFRCSQINMTQFSSTRNSVWIEYYSRSTRI